MSAKIVWIEEPLGFIVGRLRKDETYLCYYAGNYGNFDFNIGDIIFVKNEFDNKYKRLGNIIALKNEHNKFKVIVQYMTDLGEGSKINMEKKHLNKIK